MIYITTPIYAKVWKVDAKERYADVQISTSEKDKEGIYINSSWFARAIGHAFNQFKQVNDGDRITITKAKLSNPSYTDKEGNRKRRLDFVILEIDSDERQGDNDSSDSAPW